MKEGLRSEIDTRLTGSAMAREDRILRMTSATLVGPKNGSIDGSTTEIRGEHVLSEDELQTQKCDHQEHNRKGKSDK